MLASNEKISTRQAVILLIVTTFSPAIRLFPQYTAKMAGKAGWLSPIIAAIVMLILALIIQSFFKKNKDINLSDVYLTILGNIIGRIVLFIYLIWILVLTALYIRYYAERLLSSILPNTSIEFLIIVMMAMVFIAAKMGIVPLTRVNELFLGVIIGTFLVTFIFSIPQIKLRNYMYVSYLDAWPAVKASYVILAIWGYLLYFFFFGDKINDKEHIKKFAFQGIFALCPLAILLLIMTIGALGPTLATRVSLPFFIVIKNISVMGIVERIESILLAVWVISDFVIITVFIYISASLIKSIFKLSDTKFMVSPLVLLTAVGSMFLTKDSFELRSFSTYIGLPFNTVFEFVIPAIIFLIGKLRKKI